jgi:nucleoid-associated protein YgaU
VNRGAALALGLLAALVASGRDAAAEGDTHVVLPGETLWQIAAALTGDAHRWPEIYRANRDQIKDPALLHPGQRLAIPDFAATGTSVRPTPTAPSGKGPDD